MLLQVSLERKPPHSVGDSACEPRVRAGTMSVLFVTVAQGYELRCVQGPAKEQKNEADQ